MLESKHFEVPDEDYGSKYDLAATLREQLCRQSLVGQHQHVKLQKLLDKTPTISVAFAQQFIDVTDRYAATLDDHVGGQIEDQTRNSGELFHDPPPKNQD